MKRLFLFIIFSITVFVSCHRIRFDDPVLDYISRKYPLLEFNQPKLTDSIRNDIYNNMGSDAISYYYLDSLSENRIATICVFKNTNDSINLYFYTQTWESDGWNFELKIAEDTLYFYKWKELDVQFIQGEYEFRRWGGTRTHPRLSYDEQIYYDLHKDSLRKVKGNNLPQFPKLSDEEREMWEAMKIKK